MSAIRMNRDRLFKPFTVATGLGDWSILKEMRTYVCGGILHVGDHDIHCSQSDQDMGTETVERGFGRIPVTLH